MPSLQELLKTLPVFELDEGKKKVLLIYASSLLVVFLVYFFFFLKPSIGKLFELVPQAHKLRAEIKEVRNDLDFEDRFKRNLGALRQKLGRYEKKLSREKEIPMLLESFSRLARSSRVKILSITPVEKKEKGISAENIYQEVPIEIKAQSGYHELGTFINRLENDDRYMQVSDIKIKSNSFNPKRHDAEFIVYVFTFEKQT